MTRRIALTLSAAALAALTSTAGAQRASLAVGAANPVGDLSNTAKSGFDIQFQARTPPMIGPLSIQLALGYDVLGGVGTSKSTTIFAQSASLEGDFLPWLYWVAGPGFYESTQTINILGHNALLQQDYLGAQIMLGAEFPVIRWRGFVETGVVRFFSPHPTPMYIPIRFGMRL
jgi:hypothetical protein